MPTTRVDPVTLRHHELLCQYNPRYPVIPVVMRDPAVIPGTIDLATYPSKWETRDNWSTLDARIYLWFENRRLDAERYVFTEWDVRCTQCVKDFYQNLDCWDAPVAGADTIEMDEPWNHTRDRWSLPPEDRKFALGLAPLAMTLFSHKALTAIVSAAGSIYDCFSEVRLGTSAREAGYEPFPYGLRTIHSGSSSIPKSKDPGIYHPVKTLEWWDE
jgi:hypothetical protein